MLTIVFFGLIAHFQFGSRERAVLVAEPNHLAIMVIKASDLTSPIGDFAHGETFYDENGDPWGIWLLDGMHLKVQNLRAGATTIDPRIPSLAQITDGSDPLLNIKNGVLHSRTKAYVDYTGGDLSASSTCSVKWTPPLPPGQGCRPKATWTTSTATPEVTYTGTVVGDPFILNGTEKLGLKSDAKIAIFNAVFVEDHVEGHYKDYLGLFVDGSCISEIGEVDDCPKEGPNLKLPTFSLSNNHNAQTSLIRLPLDLHILDLNNPECSNSRFP